MASKAKTLQVKDKEKDEKPADAPEKDSADAPSPLLDLSDAAVKKMIKQAKKRGFVTFDQLNEVLPSDTTSPEQIEDIMSMLSDMGINVTEADDVDSEEEKQDQVKAVRAYQGRNEGASAKALERLQAAAARGGNVFEELMESVKTCSLGQISRALYEVGGQYRRNM